MKLKGENIVYRFLFQIYFTVLLTNFIAICSRDTLCNIIKLCAWTYICLWKGLSPFTQNKLINEYVRYMLQSHNIHDLF